MPSNVDERIVRMRFDNSQFSSNAKKAKRDLDDLNKSFKFDSQKKNIEELQETFDKFNLKEFDKQFEESSKGVSAWTIGIGSAIGDLLTDLRHGLSDVASTFGSTIQAAKDGMQEYEELINKTMVVMNNTGSSVEQVNDYFDDLNAYADLTIYKFSDMTRAAQNFAVAGIKDLELSANMIKGIGNASAYAGLSAEQASTAFAASSKVINMGYLNLRQYYSLMNSGFFNAEMRKQALEIAATQGLLERVSDGVYKTTSATSKKGVEVTEQNFMETLGTAKWLKSEVYRELIALYNDTDTELGRLALKAATVQKTITQVIDVAKEAAQSTWTESWRIIIGNYEEASKIFTALGNRIDGIIEEIGESRNNLLKEIFNSHYNVREDYIKNLAGEDYNEALLELFTQLKAGEREWLTTDDDDALSYREILIQALCEAFDNINERIHVFTAAFKMAFPESSAGVVQTLITKFYEFARSLKPTEEEMTDLASTVYLFFSSFRKLRDIISTFFGTLKTKLELLFDIDISLKGIVESLVNVIANVVDWLEKSVDFEKVASFIAEIVNIIVTAVGALFVGLKALYDFLAPLFAPFIEKFFTMLSTIGPQVVDFIQTHIPSAVDKIKEFLSAIDFTTAIDGLKNFFKLLKNGVNWILVNLFGKEAIKEVDDEAENMGELVAEKVEEGMNNVTGGGGHAVGAQYKLSAYGAPASATRNGPPIAARLLEATEMDGDSGVETAEAKVEEKKSIAERLVAIIKKVWAYIKEESEIIYNDLIIPAWNWIKSMFAPGGLVPKMIGWLAGAAGLLAIYKIAELVWKLVSGVVNIIYSIGTIGAAFKKLVSSAKRVMDAAVIRIYIASFSEIIKAVAIIAGLALLINLLGTERVVQGMIAIGIILGGLVVVFKSMMKVLTAAPMTKESAATIAAIVALMAAINILLMAIAGIILVASFVPEDKMNGIISLLVVVGAFVAVVMYLYGKFFNTGNKLSVSGEISIAEGLGVAGVLMAVAAILAVIVHAVSIMAKLTPEEFNQAIFALAGILSTVVLIFVAVSKLIKSAEGLKDLQQAGAILAFTALFSAITGCIISILLAISSVAAAAAIGGSAYLNSIKVISGMVAVIAIALGVMIVVLIKLFKDTSKMNYSSILAGAALVYALCLGLATIIRSIAFLAAIPSGDSAGKILALSLLMGVIGTAIAAIVSITIDGGSSVTAKDIAFIGILCAGLAGILTSLSVVMVAMAIVDPGKLVILFAGLAALFAELAVMTKVVSNIDTSTNGGAIAAIALLLGTLSACMLTLGLVNVGKAHQGAALAVIFAGAILGIATAITACKINTNDVMAIGILCAVLAASMLLLSAAAKGFAAAGWDGMLMLGATFAVILGALGAIGVALMVPAFALGLERAIMLFSLFAKVIKDLGIGMLAIAVALPLLAAAFVATDIISTVALGAAKMVGTFLTATVATIAASVDVIAKSIVYAILAIITIVGKYAPLIVKTLWNFVIQIIEAILDLFVGFIGSIVEAIFGGGAGKKFIDGWSKALKAGADAIEFDTSDELLSLKTELESCTAAGGELGDMLARIFSYNGQTVSVTAKIKEEQSDEYKKQKLLDERWAMAQTAVAETKTEFDNRVNIYGPLDAVAAKLWETYESMSSVVDDINKQGWENLDLKTQQLYIDNWARAFRTFDTITEAERKEQSQQVPIFDISSIAPSFRSDPSGFEMKPEFYINSAITVEPTVNVVSTASKTDTEYFVEADTNVSYSVDSFSNTNNYTLPSMVNTYKSNLFGSPF